MLYVCSLTRECGFAFDEGKAVFYGISIRSNDETRNRRCDISDYHAMNGTDLSPQDLKTYIAAALDSDKAEDIEVIDLRQHNSPLADFMVVASGQSSRHVAAIAHKLMERLSVRGVRDVRCEGMEQADWVVVDTGDVIVHLFRPEVREFYNIEKMWKMHQGLEIVSSRETA